MSDSVFRSVRSLHLFAEMEEENFAALMRGAYVQNFPPQVQLLTEGDPSDFLHVVVSGSVELFASWNGRETTMATIHPVTTFILAATIRQAPCLMSARTLERSRIALIPSQDVRAAFEADPTFAGAIVTELAQSYRLVVKSMKDIKLRTSIERLANYLLREQRKAGMEPAFDLKLEKRLLASYLGMTAENLSRAIKGLRPYGVVVNGSRVEITDQSDLEKFAKPSALIDDHAF